MTLVAYLYQKGNMDYPLDEKRANDAYEALVKYLASAPRSEKETREKLYQKGFHKNEVEFAIDKAKSYRYIDDEQYVRTYLTFNKMRYGSKKLAYKLTVEKGVDKALVENLIADIIEEDFEIERASTIAKKYVKQKKITEKKDYQKVGAFLYQKGFSWAIINKVMSTVFDEQFDD